MGSDQSAQGFVQLDLENLPGQRLHSPSGQSLLLQCCLHREKVSPYIQSEYLIQSLPVGSCCPAVHHCEQPSSISLVTER